MPPPKSGRPLSPEQIELIKRWIAEGAEWKGHWAYLPPTRPAVPVVPGRPHLANEIDRFIQARLAVEQLEPAPRGRPAHPDPPAQLRPDRPAADARRGRCLCQRRSGPTPTSIWSTGCSHRPHYGERMAIFWLDLVRFADTTGYHSDNHVDLYLFRDYVIRAFNANKPFDRFTIEQLAGDLVDGPTEETRIASGYNRLLQTTQEGGGQAKEYMAKYSADRVRNVSTVWLAATVGCAECHDHKFDPYKTREFYSLAAFFADVKETAVGVQEPTRFPSPAQAEELKRLDHDLAALKAIKKADRTRRNASWPSSRNGRKHCFKQIPTSLVTTSIPPRPIRVLPRGNWLDETGPVVQPAVPALLASSGDQRTRAQPA